MNGKTEAYRKAAHLLDIGAEDAAGVYAQLAIADELQALAVWTKRCTDRLEDITAVMEQHLPTMSAAAVER